MKCTVGALVLAHVMAGTPVSASDAPFGLEMGKSPSAYGCEALLGLKGPDAFIFTCDTPPQGSAYFEEYGVWSRESTGICRVEATSNNLGTENETRQSIDTVAALIASKYGDGFVKTDSLKRGSKFSDSASWNKSLASLDREYSYRWDLGAFKSWIHSIDQIDLVATGASGDTRMLLVYRYSNWNACFGEWKAPEGAEPF